MDHFLLVYDRAAGRLLNEECFAERRDALMARLRNEKAYRDEMPNVEIVVIGAPSREQLLRTHGRYFLTLDELAQRIAEPR